MKGKREGDIAITILYDNNPFDERLKTGWGFSCIIEGLSEVILFDTGGRGELLLSNMTKLAFKPEDVDIIVLSHFHGDHTGGLSTFLQVNNNVKVYMPKTFPSRLREDVKQSGVAVVECDDPCKVCDSVWTTGVLGSGIQEQGVYLKMPRGLIVITGCAHPGIVHMAEAARKHADMPVYAVLGGFHKAGASRGEIDKAIQGFKELGIQRVAPCHCSGDETRRLMKEAFTDGYLQAGVGARMVFSYKREEGK